MTEQSFNGERLRDARLRRGLTKRALGNAVDLTDRRISSFENQGEPPPQETLAKIATELRFPVTFFMRDGSCDLGPEKVSFRSYSRLSARDRDAALVGAWLASRVAAWFEAEFELPESNLPDMRDVPPAEAASSLRARWALGDAPAPNMVHLLEANGVRVFSLVDDCRALDAISTWIDDRPFVFLTQHKSPERARWDAAHELGHLVLHLGFPPHGKAQEDEADAFAAEFLLPAHGVRARAPRYPSFPDILEEKLHWKVSALAYLRQLERLDLLTEWSYRSLVIEASRAGYRTKEGDIERETSQLIPKVLDALRSEGIGVAELAAMLDIESRELRGLLFAPVSAVSGGEGTPTTRRRDHLRLVE